MTDWQVDMLKWRGRSWHGPDAHWCYDWDELPVDAFTPEYECCTCGKTRFGRICNWLYMRWFNWKNRTEYNCARPITDRDYWKAALIFAGPLILTIILILILG